MNTRGLAKASFCEIFEGQHGPVHRIALMPQPLHHFMDFEVSTSIIDDQPIARLHLWLRSPLQCWIVATPDRRKFAMRITSYPAVDISVPFDWNATAAEVTERVRAAMDD